MQGDIDSIAKTVMQSPQGLKLITGLDRFNTALASPTGRQVLALLAGPCGDSLKNAAAAASAAPKDPGRALLSALLASKEGASLISKLIELTST